MKNYRLEKGKLTQNLVLFQLVQDLIDRSNLNFKASKLILNHRKKDVTNNRNGERGTGNESLGTNVQREPA